MTRLAGRGRSLRRRACGTLLVGAIFGAFAPSAGASTGWTREFGSGAPDVVRSVAVDATGIYVAGATRSKLPFGTWAGAWDGFVRKYSLSGKLLWTDQFGTAGQDGAADVTTDGSNVYVVGWTGGSGPLPDYATSVNRNPGRAILRSYRTDGTLDWSRTFGPTGTAALSVVATGFEPIVAGVTAGTFLGQHSSGGQDAFVATFDPNAGHLGSLAQFGTAAADEAEGVAYRQGGYYVSGDTAGTLGPRSYGGVDGFVRKYHFDGSELWTRQFGTSGNDYAPAIGLRDDLYVAGESSPGVRGVDSSSYVRSFTRGGAQTWSESFGTPEGTSAYDLTLGPDAVSVTGRTFGTLPGQTPGGGADAFVHTVGLDGSNPSDVQIGTSEWDVGRGIGGGLTGTLAIGGSTSGTFPGERFHGGGIDAFLTELG